MSDDQIPDLAAIRGRVEKATEGPWHRIESRDVFAAIVAPSIATICMDCENASDADFIANARTDIPQLLALVDRLLPYCGHKAGCNKVEGDGIGRKWPCDCGWSSIEQAIRAAIEKGRQHEDY